jgi:hypothetical protein
MYDVEKNLAILQLHLKPCDGNVSSNTRRNLTVVPKERHVINVADRSNVGATWQAFSGQTLRRQLVRNAINRHPQKPRGRPSLASIPRRKIKDHTGVVAVELTVMTEKKLPV